MSGVKVIPIVAGAAPVAGSAGAGVVGASGGMAAMWGAFMSVAPALVGIVAVAAAATVIYKTADKAYKIHQNRVKAEQEAAQRREAEIQQRVATLRSQVQQKSRAVFATANMGITTEKFLTNQSDSSKVSGVSIKTGGQTREPDFKTKKELDDLNNRLPQIKSEYQSLITQDILDNFTVNEAIQKAELAIKSGNLGEARNHLKGLDEARIGVMQQLRAYVSTQLDYVQERLDFLTPRLPSSVVEDFQYKINLTYSNSLQVNDVDLQQLHQKISEFEAQANRIREAGTNLATAWNESGYEAQLIEESDNGDVIVRVETHEGAVTESRLRFDGQEMTLIGPDDQEGESCAARTFEALEKFAAQGYKLEWSSWNGYPVDEEWRQIGADATTANRSGEHSDVDEVNPSHNSSNKSYLREEAEGY